MKKTTVIVSLLVTAILCFGLASCDSKKPSPEETTSASSTAEETVTNEITSSEESSTQESSVTDISSTTKSETTTAKPNTTAAVTTTLPASKPTTTQAVTTTQPPTTTEVPTTQIVITTQSETTTAAVSDGEDSDFETLVIKLVNSERTKQGLAELKYSPELSEAAKIRAKEISTDFGHIRPDGSLSLTISPLAKGENIAKGQTTPQDVMSAWMASEGHSKNILSKAYKTIGVGCYYDSATDTYYWVQLFGI